MVAMERSSAAVAQLGAVLAKLRERGENDLAVELEGIIRGLQEPVPEPPGGVMTTGEAASILGVRSINTIKRWAREGQLEGFRRGGRILVSRLSVERMQHSPAVAAQRDQERQLDETIGVFDVGDGEVPPTPWVGRRPWEAPEHATGAPSHAAPAGSAAR